MTTIGYGDIYPTTHFGRYTTIIACIWGVFILSLFVVALTNSTEFEEKEQKAFSSIILKSKIKKHLKKEAGILIKEYLLLSLLRRRNKDEDRRGHLFLGVIQRASRFKIARCNVHGQEDDVNEMLEVLRSQVDKSTKEMREGLMKVDEVECAVDDVWDN